MADVAIRSVYYGIFEQITHCMDEHLMLAEPTFEALVAELERRHGCRFGDVLLDRATGLLQPGVMVLANGRHVIPGSVLANGDEVAFIVAMAGGSQSLQCNREGVADGGAERT